MRDSKNYGVWTLLGEFPTWNCANGKNKGFDKNTIQFLFAFIAKTDQGGQKCALPVVRAQPECFDAQQLLTNFPLESSEESSVYASGREVHQSEIAELR